MRDSAFKLITRKCLGCDKTFSVTENSDHYYHSADCESMTEKKDLSERQISRLPTKAEAAFFLTGKRPLDGKNFSVMKSLEKEDLPFYTDIETSEDK